MSEPEYMNPKKDREFNDGCISPGSLVLIVLIIEIISVIIFTITHIMK
jgi:hypothetical protein